jgi:hypothetical protein
MDPSDPQRPAKKRRVRAREILSRVVHLRPSFAAAHALLAYVLLDLDDPKAALLSLHRAVDLTPNDETLRDFLLETLDRVGHSRGLHKQLEKAATLRRIDLSPIRAELRACGFPTNASTLRLNAFPAGEQHFLSRLLDTAETIEGEYSSGVTSETERAQAARRSVTIDSRRVPADLRPVVYLARKWGIPDDADRGLLIYRANADERAEMRKVLSAGVRRGIGEWIDSFSDASSMTKEASHFMYLLEAFDEMHGNTSG